MSHPTLPHRSRSPTPTWPTSGPGRAALVVTGLAGAFVALVLFALPMLGEALGMALLPGILNTWLTPLILLALTCAVAVLGLAGRRRGDRSVIVLLVLVLSVAGGALLGLDMVLEAIAGR